MVEMFAKMPMGERVSMAQQTIAVEIIEKKIRAYQEVTFLATGSLPTEIAFCDACMQILCPAPSMFLYNKYKEMEVIQNAPMQECAVHGSKHQATDLVLHVNVQGQALDGAMLEHISKQVGGWIAQQAKLRHIPLRLERE